MFCDNGSQCFCCIQPENNICRDCYVDPIGVHRTQPHHIYSAFQQRLSSKWLTVTRVLKNDHYDDYKIKNNNLNKTFHQNNAIQCNLIVIQNIRNSSLTPALCQLACSLLEEASSFNKTLPSCKLFHSFSPAKRETDYFYVAFGVVVQ